MGRSHGGHGGEWVEGKCTGLDHLQSLDKIITCYFKQTVKNLTP